MLFRLADGYNIVNLTADDSKVKTFFVHKLIAQIFLKNVNNLNVVTHLDGDKLNNNVKNLEWR